MAEFIIPGPRSISHIRPKRKSPVRVGMAWTWFCPACEAFSITFADEVEFGEGACDHCKIKFELDIENASASTPTLPKRKVKHIGNIREVRTEW